jgi:hypothetical protein
VRHRCAPTELKKENRPVITSELSRLVRLLVVPAALLCATLAPSAALAVCGDGIFEDNEQCDDGNTVPGDCCDAECRAEDNGAPCTDDGNTCTFDVCDGEGSCNHFPDQKAQCDDGNACTLFDFCNSDGFCASEGSLEDGSICEDASLCGGSGVCTQGFCAGDPASCDGFGDLCHSATCDVESGNCVTSTLEDGTPCDDGGICTDPGECKDGECILPPRDCSEFAGPCLVANCSPELRGGCYSSPKKDGTACDDTNGCTEPGVCIEGDCNTTPKDCSSYADQCNDAACDPKSEQGCFSAPKEDTTPCDDGNGCTVSDVCTAGFCGGAPRDCSDFTDACHVGICNGDTGSCQSDLVENGTACNDQNGCTVGESCTNGECGGGTPKDCSFATTDCAVGLCNARTGQCVGDPVPNTTPCDDGDPCTVGDHCNNGVCAAGTPKDCSSADGTCSVGVCDPESGQCVAEPAGNQTSCNDGDPCTTGDQCTNGVCGGAAKDCSNLTDACHTGTCATNGDCVATNKTNGTTCNDGNLCTTGDLCTAGVCAGATKDCSSLTNTCNTGQCSANTGQCLAVPKTNGTSCSDGDLCTTGDQCAGGVCDGVPKDCSNLNDACHTGTCNGSSGQCVATNKTNGTTCNDGNLCTTADQCTSGVCGGTTKDCSSLNDACHTGTCATNGDCVAQNKTNGTTCSDANLCTTSDQCTNGACAGRPVDCSAENGSCTSGACNPDNGQCDGTPFENGTPCNDANPCTTGDQCTGGVCVGTAKDCSNLDDACHTGTCDVESGACAATPKENGTACSDGARCTTNDQCTAGSCAGTAVDCSSLSTVCRTGVCDPDSGACQAVPVTDQTPCNDGAFCTTTDICTGGNCIGAGDPCAANPTCSRSCNEASDSCTTAAGTPCESDANPCTDDVCDGEGSCDPVPNTGACDDGLFCTTDDRCSDGNCIGDPACPPTNACGDTCDEAADACRTCGHPFSNTRCIVNAIFVLRGALGLSECELCTCDVDSNGSVTVTDALMILRTCASLPTTLECPEPAVTTTTIGI